jgi:hypothetical protein
MVRNLHTGPAMSADQVDEKKPPAPRPRFVPGVYNYCDRWCERCPFNTRCVIAALHVRLEEARARGEDLASVDVPDEDPSAEDDGVARPWLDAAFAAAVNRPPTPAEERELEERRQERDRLRKADPLVVRSREYADLACRIATVLRADLEGRGDPVVLAALETIAWHAFAIAAKTSRAVGGELRRLLDDEEDEETEDDLLSDWNGSAKVARLMIAESREAWTVLMQVGRATADGLPVKMVERLERLDQDLAGRFPRAMDFVRPGFDE